MLFALCMQPDRLCAKFQQSQPKEPRGLYPRGLLDVSLSGASFCVLQFHLSYGRHHFRQSATYEYDVHECSKRLTIGIGNRIRKPLLRPCHHGTICSHYGQSPLAAGNFATGMERRRSRKQWNHRYIHYRQKLDRWPLWSLHIYHNILLQWQSNWHRNLGSIVGRISIRRTMGR